MLRSNPSARPGAEAWWGVSRHGTRPPALQPTSCFGSNAINLNPRYTAKTPLYWLAVRHMSGSSGRKGSKSELVEPKLLTAYLRAEVALSN